MTKWKRQEKKTHTKTEKYMGKNLIRHRLEYTYKYSSSNLAK
jgi:hypothetical protein